MSSRLRRWGPWALLGLILVVVLAVGATRTGGHQTLEQRTLSIAGQVRCPVCQGESAASSSTPAAQGIRTIIRNDLTHDESSAQIIRSLENDYGTTILESPPTSGITLWAWVVPVVVTGLAVVGLILGFRHWRRRPFASGPGADRTGAVPPGAPPAPAAAASAAGPPRVGPPRVSEADEALVREALVRPSGPGSTP